MSITDKLRKYALKWDKPQLMRHDLLAIADCIDAKYQKMLDEHNSERFNAVTDARDDGVNAVLKEPEGFGLIALPKDADDVQWNIGDKDEDGNKVIAFKLTSDGGWYVITDDKYPFRPENRRHYHIPTVESLIRDAIDQCIGHLPEYWDEPIAKCAAKLQLKENECSIQ